MPRTLGMRGLPSTDPQGLPPEVAALIVRLQQQVQDQAQRLSERDQALAQRDALLQRKDREIALREAKIEKIQFELARLKRCVEHRHEPDHTDCQEQGCGRPMQRIGEDVTERLDVVPAEFFVHRHIYGKWACRHCQTLKQAPSVPEIVEGGIAASGLLAHTAISRFVDHLPYYRQESINARSGVHTPRSTLASATGQVGAALEPLYELHKRFILDCRVVHADETPVALLDPGAGKTRRAYMWAYARSWHDPAPGVIYEFCRGRGAQYPVVFLDGDHKLGEHRGSGTLLTDRAASARLVPPMRAGTSRS